LAEAKAQLAKSIEEQPSAEKTFHMEMQSICANTNCHDVVFRLVGSGAENSANDLSVVDICDLIFLEPASSISSEQQSTQMNNNSTRRLLAKVIDIRRPHGTITVRVNLTKHGLQLFSQFRTNSRWFGLQLCNLSTVQRELIAAQVVGKLPLSADILNARLTIFKPQTPRDAAILKKFRDFFGLNESQALAAFRACYQPNGFVLIQGPPGTGTFSLHIIYLIIGRMCL
jgi:hypothetical protein